MTVHDPDVCMCFHCANADWEAELKQKKMTVEVEKVRGNGEMPPFLGVIHRHFEKARPACGVTTATLTAPLEMLEFMLPAALVNTIESVEIVYRK